MWFLLLLACRTAVGPADTAPGDTGPTDDAPGDTAPDDTGGSDTAPDDTGSAETALDDTGEERPLGHCPEGMSPIPIDRPAFCIHTWEIVAEEGEARSRAGVIPTTGLSWRDAAALCAATPVRDEAGATVGFMRLATVDEWRDAGDGVLGEGGTTYPWGDTWQDGVCAVPDQGQHGTLTETQPTGAWPDCVSVFGVYDQIGNLWEWVDAGLWVSFADWEAARARDGAEVTLTEDAVVVAGGAVPDRWEARIAGLGPSVLSVDEEGRLRASLAAVTGFPNGVTDGYLIAPTGDVGEDFLPVRLDLEEGVDPARVVPAYDRDGEPVPGKVGGAWYTGGGSTLETLHLEHPPDFGGTIGHRCTAEPLPEP